MAYKKVEQMKEFETSRKSNRARMHTYYKLPRAGLTTRSPVTSSWVFVTTRQAIDAWVKLEPAYSYLFRYFKLIWSYKTVLKALVYCLGWVLSELQTLKRYTPELE